MHLAMRADELEDSRTLGAFSNHRLAGAGMVYNISSVRSRRALLIEVAEQHGYEPPLRSTMGVIIVYPMVGRKRRWKLVFHCQRYAMPVDAIGYVEQAFPFGAQGGYITEDSACTYKDHTS